MKLLRKLIIRVMLLVLIAGSVIGGLSVAKSYKATKELTFDKMESELALRASIIDEKIASTTRLIEVFGHDPEVVRTLTYGEESKTVKDLFTATVENNSDLITLVALIDRDDMVLFSDSINDIKDIDLSQRQYLIDAKSSKDTVVSEIIVSKADSSSSIAICMPIYNGDFYVGSIVSTVRFNIISDLVDDIKVGENGYAFVIDIKGEDAGLTVDHPDETMINSMNIYDLGISGLTELADKMTSQESGTTDYSYKGVDKHVAFTRITDNWALAVTANEDELTVTSQEILKLTIIVIILVFILSIGLGYLVVNRMIVKPIKKLQNSMEKAGQGDLTQVIELKTKDEIEILGNSFNLMVENQKNILSEINQVSQDMSASAEELTASAEEVNESAEDVSSNIQVMMNNIMSESDAMVDVENQIQMLNQKTEMSSEIIAGSKEAASETLTVAEEGRQGVTTSVDSIRTISTSTDEVMEAFTSLNDHAKEVTGISTVISTIADQINLLALNASIEAARAGDAGRGFTVVAEEVRKLAEQTSQESSNISNVLETIITLIEEVNESINRVKNHVDTGSDTINQLDGKFLEIIASFDTLNQSIDTLSDISNQQVEITDVITSKVNEITEMNQGNTSSAQEISASTEEQTAITENLTKASEETSLMANHLNELIERFKL